MTRYYASANPHWAGVEERLGRPSGVLPEGRPYTKEELEARMHHTKEAALEASVKLVQEEVKRLQVTREALQHKINLLTDFIVGREEDQ